MTRQEAIAEGILSCKPWLARYLVGFDESNHTRQAPGLPNHVAWCLGHLALTMHRVAEKLDGKPPSESDFIAGAARGDKSRYATESVCFGSRPADDPAAYPAFARCREIYDRACDRLGAAVRAADDRTLDSNVRWGIGDTPLWALAQRMLFHNGDHTGQIADLRRALGMKPIIS
jgi:hypothetical protein